MVYDKQNKHIDLEPGKNKLQYEIRNKVKSQMTKNGCLSCQIQGESKKEND